MTRDKRALDGIDEDIKDHIERQTQDNIDAGMAPEEARRQAMLKFGNVALVKEDTRAIWVSRRLDETRQDVRYALRAMRRTRGATIVGILVMALGIGANTAVFSVVHAVLLNPLPYADPDRIVTLTYLSTGGNASGERSRQVSVPDFLDWQAQSASFDSMAYYTSRRTSVMAGSVAEYAVVTTVTEEFFRVFAGQPSVGRSFSREEAKEGGAGAAMISDRYARQQFGEPARGLGRTLRLGNRSVSIVGVMPPAFDFPVATDVWFTAVGSRAQLHRRGNNFRAIARLKADVSVEQAHTEMTGISERLGEQYPDTNKNMRVIVTPLQREMVGDVESMLYLLLGAVALVLLIACATMATLLLAKATARIPEMAVRAALGASRSRIVKQMLVEASVQAVAAGTIGVLIAIWGTRTLVAFSPPDVPRLDEVAVNGSVLLFTLALCALVSFLFGLPPALQAARADVNEPLRLQHRPNLGRRAEPHARGTRCCRNRAGGRPRRDRRAARPKSRRPPAGPTRISARQRAPDAGNCAAKRFGLERQPCVLRGRARRYLAAAGGRGRRRHDGDRRETSNPIAAIGSIGCQRSRR